MAVTVITGQRVRVIPRDLGREYTGPATSEVYEAHEVRLTAEDLRARGGEPPRAGQGWSCYLDLLYLSSAGVVTAQALTAATPVGSLLTIYDPTTREVVETRQLGAAIPDVTPAIYELALVGSGSPGRVVVTWHETEETLPDPGTYSWDLALRVNSETFIAAAGVIEILAATPEVTA